MRLVFGLVLLIGIGLAGAAVYLARDFIGQQQQQLAAAEAAKKEIVPTAEVYVAVNQLRYGQRLSMDDLKKVRWPIAAIPEGAFTAEEDLFPKGVDQPRAILRTIEPDEAILAVKVTEAGVDAGVSSRLSPGKRAFAIRTDVTSGVSGFLRPGDRVDIYWTGNIFDQSATRLIESSVKLIAINQSADEDRTGPVVAKTVTVEVDKQQVAALATAQSSGRLSLSLVGANDTEVGEEVVEVNLENVLGIERQQVVEAPTEKVCTIKKRVGTETVVEEIPCATE